MSSPFFCCYKDQLNPVAQLDGQGNVTHRFIYGAKANVPAYMVKNGTKYRIVSDHLGSVRLVINTATGEIAQRLDYSPFGKVTTDQPRLPALRLRGRPLRPGH